MGEFIPGREFRCGAIDLPQSLKTYQNGENDSAEHKSNAGGYSNASLPQPGGLQAIPAMIEYVMVNKDMPIRTAADTVCSIFGFTLRPENRTLLSVTLSGASLQFQ